MLFIDPSFCLGTLVYHVPHYVYYSFWKCIYNYVDRLLCCISTSYTMYTIFLDVYYMGVLQLISKQVDSRPNHETS